MYVAVVGTVTIDENATMRALTKRTGNTAIDL